MDACDIFVSYSHQDRDRVKILVSALASEGWQVFWDRTIPPGESWRTWIGAPLAAAPVVIVCWTRDSVESDWVGQEADAAAKRRVLLPVMLDHVTPPLGLAHIHAADLVAWTQEGGGELPAVLKQAIVRKLPSAGATPPVPRQGIGPPRQRVGDPTERVGQPPQRTAPAPRRGLYMAIGATLALLALLVGGWFLFADRASPTTAATPPTPAQPQQAAVPAQPSGKPAEIGALSQAEMRDAADKITVEAATIHVIACGGGSTPGIYVYEYVNRRGFRAVQPPNWGTALGGKDFATLAEAIGAGCAAAPASGTVLGPPYDGFALGGGDILRYYGSPSESACRADCERDAANCRAYTWVKPEGYVKGDPPVCYLMASYRDPVRHKCCVTATRGPFPVK